MDITKQLSKFVLIASFFTVMIQPFEINHKVDISKESRNHEVVVTIPPESRKLDHEVNLPTNFEHDFSKSTYSNIILTSLVIAGVIIFKEGLAKYIEDMENKKLLRKRRGREQMVIGGLVGIVSVLKLFEYI